MASTTQTTQTPAQASPSRATTTLEFAQAMADFTTMFPDVDKVVIEAVLRSNQGVVDATIDQLLTMSLDTQNEKLRNGPEPRPGPSTGNIIDLDDDDDELTDSGQIRLISSTPLSPAQLGRHSGASPKITTHASASTAPHNQQHIFVEVNGGGGSSINTIMGCDDVLVIQHRQWQQSRWRPALLGPLPPGFLRLSSEGTRGQPEFDIPDEQLALMLQNEEFMHELRWNPEFLHALEREGEQWFQQQQQQQKATDAASGSGGGGSSSGSDVAQFRERVRHMGKRSRKKFAMLARVFTWQRHKKPGAVRHPDSLPLREEHSDDDTDAQHLQKQQRGRDGVPKQ